MTRKDALKLRDKAGVILAITFYWCAYIANQKVKPLVLSVVRSKAVEVIAVALFYIIMFACGILLWQGFALALDLLLRNYIN